MCVCGGSIDLSYNPLGDKGVRRVVHALRNNDLTERLNLAGTQMGAAAAKEVKRGRRRTSPAPQH